MKSLAVLGSTGSIGRSTLEVVALHPDRYRVEGLAAYASVERMLEQCRRFKPNWVVMVDEAAARRLREALRGQGSRIQVDSGLQALDDAVAASSADLVVAAIVGAAGLGSTLAAARAGKRILLANKESLVLGGALLCAQVEAHGARLFPVDSEHNAIHQCLPRDAFGAARTTGVEKILLTASGGPFRNHSLQQLTAVTPEQACAHPNWSMGRKISVDSATMMNKGLEVIEAHWLFSLPARQIEVLVHPQSIVHSLVQYQDGSMLAQLGSPDMRIPIAYALAWPLRVDSGAASLDLTALAGLEFEAPDRQRFPCLQLAYQALEAGGAWPGRLNAANEVAVEAFLEERIGFLDIHRVISETLEQDGGSPAMGSLDDLLAIDRRARRDAAAIIRALPPR
jgi:1-deoxy-D-xylulose-5-phosphate reductoisomerase